MTEKNLKLRQKWALDFSRKTMKFWNRGFGLMNQKCLPNSGGIDMLENLIVNLGMMKDFWIKSKRIMVGKR